MHNHTTVAIIWASFAGLSSLLVLRKRLGKDATIKIFDQRQHFTYIPWLHEAILNKPERLRSMQIDLKKRYPCSFVQQKVTHLEEHTLTTEDGTARTFDYLVIATGSRTNFFDNQKRKNNAHSVRYAEDIEPLNKALETAKNITVIWWGYTWIEVAAIIAERKKPEQQLRVIHSRERLFNRLSKTVSRYSETWLAKKWVEVLLNERVKDIDTDTLTLSSWDIIPSDVTIVSRGIKTNSELYQSTFTFATSYDAEEAKHIFICGDVAINWLYTTAHNAMIEWRRVGHLVADTIQWRIKQYPPLKNRDKLAIALGQHDWIFTNGKKWFYVPWLTGLSKKIIERRVLFEFTYKIMLWV